MPSYVTLDVLNNKFPCEGPRVVACPCDFSTAQTFDVDLKTLQMRGKISDIQSLFVDNSDNNAALIITASVQGQRIVIPPYAQAYIAILLNQAQFRVTSASLALVPIYAQNFPVSNCVWNSNAAGTAQNVAVTNLPLSQPVSLTSSISSAFLPSGTGANLATSAASANVAIATVAGQNIRLLNTGAFPVAVRWGAGAQIAVATDLTVMPNQSILVNGNGANNLAAISPGGAGSLNIVVGNGGLSA